MTLETFFERFTQFADAPEAVKRLRELVLELAVQGRLVLQDGTEESAFVAEEGRLHRQDERARKWRGPRYWHAVPDTRELGLGAVAASA